MRMMANGNKPEFCVHNVSSKDIKCKSPAGLHCMSIQKVHPKAEALRRFIHGLYTIQYKNRPHFHICP
jgi:hypothetical protein